MTNIITKVLVLAFIVVIFVSVRINADTNSKSKEANSDEKVPEPAGVNSKLMKGNIGFMPNLQDNAACMNATAINQTIQNIRARIQERMNRNFM